jgi:hypothetical protein
MQYSEEGISPREYSKLMVATEGPYFPIHMVPTTLPDGLKLNLPLPHHMKDAPIRSIEMTHALLRPFVHKPEGLPHETKHVPRSSWTIRFDQSYEDVEMRYFKSSLSNSDDPKNKEKLVPEGDGKNDSPFGVPKKVDHHVTFFDTEGTPRERLQVVFNRTSSDEDSPLFNPSVIKLFDRFLDAPEDVLYVPGQLSENHLSHHIWINGRMPIGSGKEIKFSMKVDTKEKKFYVVRTETVLVRSTIINAFRDHDFNPPNSRFFEYTLAQINETPYTGDADKPTEVSDMTQKQLFRTLQAYVALTLPRFKGFSQKYVK